MKTYTYHLNRVLEAAQIRIDQLRDIDAGRDTCEILAEADEMRPGEAETLADGLADSVATVSASDYTPAALVEAALCIWEDALTFNDAHGNQPRLDWLQGEGGAVTGRQQALELAPIFESAWEAAQRLGFDDCFDWEFVPRVFEYLTLHFESPDDVLGSYDSTAFLTDLAVHAYTDWCATFRYSNAGEDFIAGYRARLNGHESGENPHDAATHTRRHRDWLRGWAKAVIDTLEG